MNRSVSPRFVGLVLLGVAALVATLVFRQPALAGVAAGLLAVPAVGAALHRWPQLELDVSVSHPRVVEGDRLQVIVAVDADCDVPWVDVELELPATLASGDGVLRRVVAVEAGVTRLVRFVVQPETWGVVGAGRIRLVARDRFGLFSTATLVTASAAVRVYPAEGRLGGLVPPVRTNPTLGSHRSQDRGDGCEFADLRPFRVGDRARDVNWRVSGRRGATWVNERHPERSTDVVLILDDTVDHGGGPAGAAGAGAAADDGTLRLSIRAALALAESHLGAQDRVGLAALGAPLRWIRPRVGRRQLYQVVDVLLDSQTARSAGASAAELSVIAGLAPGTTVVALTALGEPRVIEALVDLARRGHHVVVLEVPAEATLPAPSTQAAAVARSIWQAERGVLRRRLSELGLVLVPWDGVASLAMVLAAAGAVRAGARGGRRQPRVVAP